MPGCVLQKRGPIAGLQLKIAGNADCGVNNVIFDVRSTIFTDVYEACARLFFCLFLLVCCVFVLFWCAIVQNEGAFYKMGMHLFNALHELFAWKRFGRMVYNARLLFSPSH